MNRISEVAAGTAPLDAPDLRRDLLPQAFCDFVYEGVRPLNKNALSDKSYLFRRAIKE